MESSAFEQEPPASWGFPPACPCCPIILYNFIFFSVISLIQNHLNIYLLY